MRLTSAPESGICGLPRWASTLSDSTPVRPHTSTAHRLSSPMSRLLVAPQKRKYLIPETKGLLWGQGWLLPARETPLPRWAADSSFQTEPTSLTFISCICDWSMILCPSVKVSVSLLKSQHTEYFCHRKVRQRLLWIFSKQLGILHWYEHYNGVKARRINKIKQDDAHTAWKLCFRPVDKGFSLFPNWEICTPFGDPIPGTLTAFLEEETQRIWSSAHNFLIWEDALCFRSYRDRQTGYLCSKNNRRAQFSWLRTKVGKHIHTPASCFRGGLVRMRPLLSSPP